MDPIKLQETVLLFPIKCMRHIMFYNETNKGSISVKQAWPLPHHSFKLTLFLSLVSLYNTAQSNCTASHFIFTLHPIILHFKHYTLRNSQKVKSRTHKGPLIVPLGKLLKVLCRTLQNGVTIQKPFEEPLINPLKYRLMITE